MAVTALEIMTNDGQDLPLPRDIRDALAVFARKQWPTNTAKQMARTWKIAPTTATNILKGHASATTLTHVMRIGGWGVVVPVLGAVIGQSFERWLNEEQGRLARERIKLEAQERRLVEMAARARALPSVLGARVARLGSDGLGQAGDGVGRGPFVRNRAADD